MAGTTKDFCLNPKIPIDVIPAKGICPYLSCSTQGRSRSSRTPGRMRWTRRRNGARRGDRAGHPKGHRESPNRTQKNHAAAYGPSRVVPSKRSGSGGDRLQPKPETLNRERGDRFRPFAALFQKRIRGCGCIGRPAFRMPSLTGGRGRSPPNLGLDEPRDREIMSPVIPGCSHSERTGIQTSGSAVQHLRIRGSRKRAPRNDEAMAV
jgi:hypothetical protein